MSYNFNVKNAEDFHERLKKVHKALIPPPGKMQGRVSTKLEAKSKKTLGDRLPFLEKILSILGIHIMSRTEERAVARVLENFVIDYAPGSSKKKVPKEGYISIADKNIALECIKKLSDQATEAGVKNLKIFEKAHATISAITIPKKPLSKQPVNSTPPKPIPDPELVPDLKPIPDEKNLEKQGLKKQLKSALGSKDFNMLRSLVKQTSEEGFNEIFTDEEVLSKYFKEKFLSESKEKFFSKILEEKQLDIAELLLSKGFQPPPLSLLISSIKKDDLDIAEFILKHVKFTMESILKEKSVDVKTVKFLIQEDMDVGNEHLLIALSFKHLDIAEFFVNEHKMNVNGIFLLLNSWHEIWKTPEHIDFLLDHGANINFGDQEGQTILYRMIWCQEFDKAQALIDRGADLQHEDKEGKTILSHLIEKDYFESFEFVINARIEKYGLKDGLAKGVNDLNHSPLYMISGYNYDRRTRRMLFFLLDKGANITTPNIGTTCETPLYRAIEEVRFTMLYNLIGMFKAAGVLDEESKMALLAKAKANSKYEKKLYDFSKKEIDELTQKLKLNVNHRVHE